MTTHERRRSLGQCVRCGVALTSDAAFCVSCAAKKNKTTKDKNNKRRDIVFKHYGDQCKCCGESRREFFTIDHINGGGTKLRNTDMSYRGSRYWWIIKRGFPKDLRILCANCNQATIGGRLCPHQVGIAHASLSGEPQQQPTPTQ